MRSKVTFATLILLLGLLFCGAVLPACGHRDDEADLGPLPDIERLLHSPLVVNPDLDSAVAMMAGLRPEQFESPRARALYDLMCKEVDYKLSRETPDDSTLLVAAECFRKEGDRRRLMRAIYQIGRTRYIGGDFRGGMKAALEAMDLARELGDVLYLAKTNELCADNLNHVYNFVESANYCRRAAEYYDRYGWKENAMVLSADVSSNLFNLQRYEEALAITDSILAHPGSSDPDVLAYVYERRIRPNWRLGRVQEARANLDSAIKYDPSARYRNHINPVIVALAENDTVAARLEISELKNGKYSDIEDLDILYLEYMLYLKTGEKEKAIETQRVLKDMDTDTLLKICRMSPELSNYLNSEKEEKIDTLTGSVSKYRWQIALMWIVALFFLIIVVVFSVVLYRRWADKGQKLTRSLEEKSQAIAEYARMLEEQQALLEQRDSTYEDDRKSEMSGSTAEMMRQQIKALNDLCSDYYDKKDSPDKVRLSVLSDMEKHLSRLADKDYLRQVELYLDFEKDGVATKLKTLLPDLNKKDLTILLLSMTPLSVKAICVICGLSSNAYLYNRKRVLKSRIRKIGTPEAEEIYEMLP